MSLRITIQIASVYAQGVINTNHVAKRIADTNRAVQYELARALPKIALADLHVGSGFIRVKTSGKLTKSYFRKAIFEKLFHASGGIMCRYELIEQITIVSTQGIINTNNVAKRIANTNRAAQYELRPCVNTNHRPNFVAAQKRHRYSEIANRNVPLPDRTCTTPLWTEFRV